MLRLMQNGGKYNGLFPKNTTKSVQNMFTLKFHSESSLMDYEVIVPDDSNNNDYYDFTFELEIPKGEYVYTVSNDHICLAKGIILFDCDYIEQRKNNTIVNNNDKNGYIVFNG